MEDLKAKIFDDLVPRAEFAKALGKSERTVIRMGFPTKMVGRDAYIVISGAKAKIHGEAKKRGPGRPRAA